RPAHAIRQAGAAFPDSAEFRASPRLAPALLWWLPCPHGSLEKTEVVCMSMDTRDPSQPATERPRYIERCAPVVFPVSAEMPDVLDHVKLRWLLFHLLERTIGSQVTVGCDQLVYL